MHAWELPFHKVRSPRTKHQTCSCMVVLGRSLESSSRESQCMFWHNLRCSAELEQCQSRQASRCPAQTLSGRYFGSSGLGEGCGAHACASTPARFGWTTSSPKSLAARSLTSSAAQWPDRGRLAQQSPWWYTTSCHPGRSLGSWWCRDASISSARRLRWRLLSGAVWTWWRHRSPSGCSVLRTGSSPASSSRSCPCPPLESFCRMSWNQGIWGKLRRVEPMVLFDIRSRHCDALKHAGLSYMSRADVTSLQHAETASSKNKSSPPPRPFKNWSNRTTRLQSSKSSYKTHRVGC